MEESLLTNNQNNSACSEGIITQYFYQIDGKIYINLPEICVFSYSL